MSLLPLEWTQPRDHPEANTVSAKPSDRLRTAGLVLRAVFLACLVAITVRVSLPQSETIWTAYDTPGDLVRLVLGLAVCVWIGVQLFWMPDDEHSHRTWLQFGAVAIPFALICLVFIW
jgi:uncharacterized membrane protein